MWLVVYVAGAFKLSFKSHCAVVYSIALHISKYKYLP